MHAYRFISPYLLNEIYKKGKKKYIAKIANVIPAIIEEPLYLLEDSNHHATKKKSNNNLNKKKRVKNKIKFRGELLSRES